jgi:hypothetical protein
MCARSVHTAMLNVLYYRAMTPAKPTGGRRPADIPEHNGLFHAERRRVVFTSFCQVNLMFQSLTDVDRLIVVYISRLRSRRYRPILHQYCGSCSHPPYMGFSQLRNDKKMRTVLLRWLKIYSSRGSRVTGSAFCAGSA